MIDIFVYNNGETFKNISFPRNRDIIFESGIEKVRLTLGKEPFSGIVKWSSLDVSVTTWLQGCAAFVPNIPWKSLYSVVQNIYKSIGVIFNRVSY